MFMIGTTVNKVMRAVSLFHLISSVVVAGALVLTAPYAGSVTPYLVQFGMPEEKLGLFVQYIQVAMYICAVVIALSGVALGALMLKLDRDASKVKESVQENLNKFR